MANKRKPDFGQPPTRRAGAYKAAPGRDATKIIDAHLQRTSANLRRVAQELRRLVRKTVPQSREAINPWGIPTFDFNGPLCFMMIAKQHVTFGFPRGTSLADPGGLLEGTGKNLRHVKLREPEQLHDGNVRRLILEAAELNRETPLTPSMRPKKIN